MATRRSLAWTELRVGILVITSFALLALAIFYVSGQSGFFVRRYTIIAYFQNANNLRSGAEVSLEGVTIGNVSQVAVSKESDPTKAVEAVLKLDSKYKNIIRSDSRVTISTIGLLGDSKVDITRGSEAGTVIEDGGTIQGSEEGDVRRIVQGANDVVANFQVLSEDFKKITDRIERGEGTLGKFLTDTSIYDNANNAARELNTLVRDARTGPGTMGRLISDDELYRKVMQISDRVDTLVMKVESGNGAIAKFVNDPTFYHRVDNLTAKFQNVADRIDRGEGTLGKLSKDEALYNDVRSSMTRVNTLLDSIQNGEGTIGKFIKDPSLFNNANQVAAELEKLMYDFRQNPKKFLTVNLKLF
ncbi:MAG TPA: MlaD family protein [Terriglobia bacterium]|nr:MlaD family protein [Terriglobia bacterium]